MKNRSAFQISTFLLFLGISFQITSTAEAYHNASLDYEAPIPNEWTKLPYPFSWADMWSPIQGKNVMFKIVRNPQSPSLEKFAELSEKADAQAQVKERQSKNATVSDQHAIRVQKTIKGGTIVTDYLVSHKDAVYSITLSGDPASYAQTAATFERIVQNFRFLEKDSQTVSINVSSGSIHKK